MSLYHCSLFKAFRQLQEPLSALAMLLTVFALFSSPGFATTNNSICVSEQTLNTQIINTSAIDKKAPLEPRKNHPYFHFHCNLCPCSSTLQNDSFTPALTNYFLIHAFQNIKEPVFPVLHLLKSANAFENSNHSRAPPLYFRS